MTDTGKREWSDWAGAAFMLALTVYFFRHISRTGFLLLPTVLHEFVTACAFLIRRSAKAKTSTVGSRIAAYGMTLSFLVFMQVAQRWYPDLIAGSHWPPLIVIGTFIWLVGCIFGVWGVWALRYSFSIEPQARRLVMDGPYRFARHPIYASYILQYTGIFLMHDTWQVGAVLAIWTTLLYFRMRYEETVLLYAFPEYRAFQNAVGPFWPRFKTFPKNTCELQTPDVTS